MAVLEVAPPTIALTIVCAPSKVSLLIPLAEQEGSLIYLVFTVAVAVAVDGWMDG